MYPSLRGGNDNPGVKESFLGEVDDVLAAFDYLSAQPYVESNDENVLTWLYQAPSAGRFADPRRQEPYVGFGPTENPIARLRERMSTSPSMWSDSDANSSRSTSGTSPRSMSSPPSTVIRSTGCSWRKPSSRIWISSPATRSCGAIPSALSGSAGSEARGVGRLPASAATGGSPCQA